MTFWGIGAFLVLVWGFFAYNRFVSLRRRADEAWSGIGVQLKRRHDLIPALADVVRAYAAHEKGLFAEVARIRAEAGILPGAAPSPALAEAEARAGGLVKRLAAVSEAYPELKADTNFLALQTALSDTEDQLQMARRYYNGTVRNYMVWRESFPSLLIARAFSFGPREYFQPDGAAAGSAPGVFP